MLLAQFTPCFWLAIDRGGKARKLERWRNNFLRSTRLCTPAAVCSNALVPLQGSGRARRSAHFSVVLVLSLLALPHRRHDRTLVGRDGLGRPERWRMDILADERVQMDPRQPRRLLVLLLDSSNPGDDLLPVAFPSGLRADTRCALDARRIGPASSIWLGHFARAGTLCHRRRS